MGEEEQLADEAAAQRNRSLDWINERWTQPRQCPICGTADWSVGDVGEMRRFNGGEMFVFGPRASLLPLFPVTCNNCGYTHLFNAIVTGVIPNHGQMHEDDSRG